MGRVRVSLASMGRGASEQRGLRGDGGRGGAAAVGTGNRLTMKHLFCPLYGPSVCFSVVSWQSAPVRISLLYPK